MDVFQTGIVDHTVTSIEGDIADLTGEAVQDSPLWNRPAPRLR